MKIKKASFNHISLTCRAMILGCVLMGFSALAQSWTNRYDGPAHSNDGAEAIAVDGNGNIYVTGYSFGSGNATDLVTIKYSNTGMPLWTNRYDGLANLSDGASAVAVDANGNIYVTGSFWSNSSRSDYATLAYGVVTP